MIKFGYTILYVSNVERSILFYEQAFNMKRKFLSPDQTYGELNTGKTTLSFAAHTLATSNLPDGYTESDPFKRPFGFEIGFTTNDVEQTVKAAIKAGGKLAASPKTKPWWQVVAYVRDPDGFLVEIFTPVD